LNETTDELSDIEKAAANVAMIQFAKKYPQFNIVDNKATFDKIFDETVWTINTFLMELDRVSNGEEQSDDI
jgi:hypothetical protein